MDILVHISAPTSRKDDERYRALAEAYNDFELAGDFTAKIKFDKDAENEPDQPQTGVPRRDSSRNRDGAALDHPRDRASSSASGQNDIGRVDLADREGAVKGPAQHLPAAGNTSRASHMAPGAKALAHFDEAPDFGSFGTSAQATQLSENIENPEPHGQPSTTQSHGNVGLQRTDSQTFIEDTQQGIAALQSDLFSSFPDEWLSSDPMGSSPILERPSKRLRLSPGSEINEPFDDAQMDENPQHATTSNFQSPEMSPKLPGSMNSQMPSSQLPEDYGLGDWQTPTSSMGAPISSLKSQSENYVDPAPMAVHNVLAPSSPEEAMETRRSNCDRTAETTFLLSQSSLQDDANDVQDRASQADQDASTSLVKDTSEKNKGASDGSAYRNEGPANYDFASLPIKLFSPSASVSNKTSFNEMTELLEQYVENLPLEKHYRPAFVSRPINDTDRGCWMFDTSTWRLDRQYEFWTGMQELLEKGYLENVSCQRNISNDIGSDRTDGKEAEGLGMVWLFCWGQVAPHIWLVMLVQSHLEVRKSKARWTVGPPPEDLEVVVQMP